MTHEGERRRSLDVASKHRPRVIEERIVRIALLLVSELCGIDNDGKC